MRTMPFTYDNPSAHFEKSNCEKWVHIKCITERKEKKEKKKEKGKRGHGECEG